MNKQRKIFQIRKQDTTSVKDLNEMHINNSYDEEFKVMNITMFTEQERGLGKQSEHFNKKTKGKRTKWKSQS